MCACALQSWFRSSLCPMCTHNSMHMMGTFARCTHTHICLKTRAHNCVEEENVSEMRSRSHNARDCGRFDTRVRPPLPSCTWQLNCLFSVDSNRILPTGRKCVQTRLSVCVCVCRTQTEGANICVDGWNGGDVRIFFVWIYSCAGIASMGSAQTNNPPTLQQSHIHSFQIKRCAHTCM